MTDEKTAEPDKRGRIWCVTCKKSRRYMRKKTQDWRCPYEKKVFATATSTEPLPDTETICPDQNSA